jgi:hypothetical protein
VSLTLSSNSDKLILFDSTANTIDTAINNTTPVKSVTSNNNTTPVKKSGIKPNKKRPRDGEFRSPSQASPATSAAKKVARIENDKTERVLEFDSTDSIQQSESSNVSQHQSQQLAISWNQVQNHIQDILRLPNRYRELYSEYESLRVQYNELVVKYNNQENYKQLCDAHMILQQQLDQLELQKHKIATENVHILVDNSNLQHELHTLNNKVNTSTTLNSDLYKQIKKLETKSIQQLKKLDKLQQRLSSANTKIHEIQHPSLKVNNRYTDEVYNVLCDLQVDHGVSANKAGHVLSDCLRSLGFEVIPPERSTATRAIAAKLVASDYTLARRIHSSNNLYLGIDGTSNDSRYIRAISIGGISIAQSDTPTGRKSKIVSNSAGNRFEFWETVLILDEPIEHTAKNAVDAVDKAWKLIRECQSQLKLSPSCISTIDSVSFDHASENTGSDNGFGAALNKLRKHYNPECSDLIIAGCVDHLMNLVTKWFRREICAMIEADPKTYNGLVNDKGNCIVYEVIARINNLDIRRRYTDMYRVLDRQHNAGIRFDQHTTDNRYISLSQGAINVRKVMKFDMHNEVRKHYDVSSDEEASKLDTRDVTALKSKHMPLILLFLEFTDQVHRFIMKEVNDIYDSRDYSQFITRIYKDYRQWEIVMNGRLRFEQMEVLQDALQFIDRDIDIKTLLQEEWKFKFLCTLFNKYINIFITLTKKHDGQHLDSNLDSSQEWDNEDNIRLIRPTSRVVERLLGSTVGLMGGNNRIRAIVVLGYLRGRTLDINWMRDFTPAERAKHRTEGRKRLDSSVTHLALSEKKLELRKLKKRIQVRQEQEREEARQMKEDNRLLLKELLEEIRLQKQRLREDKQIERENTIMEREWNFEELVADLSRCLTVLLRTTVTIDKPTVAVLKQHIPQINRLLPDHQRISSQLVKDQLIAAIKNRAQIQIDAMVQSLNDTEVDSSQ